MIDEGELARAEVALSLFLEFGPTNLEALKLKAHLYSQKGLFAKEYETWLAVGELAPEDMDVLEYFESHFFEEREHFYFTDLIPEGGRRFLIHPKALLEAFGIGFVSCVFFLLIGHFSKFSQFMSMTGTTLLFAGIFVFLPWIGVALAYLRMPFDVSVTPKKLKLSTKLKDFEISWGEIKEIFVLHDCSKGVFSLELLVLPKSESKEAFRIDLSEEKALIKARRFFLAEILIYYPNVKYKGGDRVKLKLQRAVSF